MRERFPSLLGALILTLTLVATPTASFAGIFVGIGIGVSVNVAPPPLPIYEQPPCVVADTIWTPGYWAYGPYGYYWVPGTWIAAPRPGYLWTPGYWGYGGGGYAWHAGYWGPHVGFYGGVNYGYGYTGNGFFGGDWHGDHFAYNTAVTNVNQTIVHNVYINRTVINNYNNVTINRTSYNGGPAGIRREPSPQELAYRNEPHLDATATQQAHFTNAAQNRNFLATVNHGRPTDAAVAAPLSSERRPANFAPVTAADRRVEQAATDGTARDTPRGVAASSAFARFKQPAQTDTLPRETGTISNGERAASTYREPSTNRAENTYRVPSTQHAASAYREPSTQHAASAYREPSTERAASAYREPTTNRAASLYRAPNVERQTSAARSYEARPSRPAQTVRRPAAASASHAVEHAAPHASEEHHGRR